LLTDCWVVTSRATWNWNCPMAAPSAALAVRTFSSLLVVAAAENVCGLRIDWLKMRMEPRRV
jgi:hypothetical protein